MGPSMDWVLGIEERWEEEEEKKIIDGEKDNFENFLETVVSV